MHRLILAALMIACAAQVAAAQEKKNGDPKSAAKAFAQALVDGDADEAKKYFDGDDESQELIEPMANASIAYRKAAEAALAKFGDEAKTVYDKNRNEILLNRIERAEEHIDGDEATLERSKNKADPIHLRKTDDGWKICKLPDSLIKAREEIGMMAEAMEAVAKGIVKGDYKTAVQSHDAIREKARELAAKPATQP